MSARPTDFHFETWFWSKVARSEGCWLWTGTRHKEGYGMLRVPGDRSYKRAPRIAWLLTYGEIPDGMLIRHTCDNPPCVRPSHLLVGSTVDNVGDKVSRGRQLKGEQVSNAVLTGDDVITIRNLYSTGRWTHQELAAMFGVSQTPIALLLNRKTWRHI